MPHAEFEKDIEFILANLDDTRRVIKHAYRIRKQLVSLTISGMLDERNFYRITSVLTPQSRSTLWQNYFRKKHRALKVKADQNRGDFEKNGTFYEYKASGFNEGNVLHIVQIRLWQNCDYVIESISDNGAVTFILDHQEMVFETEAVPATVAHGTKLVTDRSEHVELRMTLRRDSEAWDRWTERYTNRTLKEVHS